VGSDVCCKCFVHDCKKLTSCFVLKCKEEGSSEMHRYSVLCEASIVESLCCNYLIEIIKKKILWM
jgi:hypothetical protein